MTPVEARQFAASSLEGEEQLLWTGFPNPEESARMLIPFSVIGVLCLVFAFGLTVQDIVIVDDWTNPKIIHFTNDMGSYFFSIGSFLAGLGMVVSPIVAYRRAKQIVYAITNRRVLTLYRAGLRYQRLEAFDRRCINKVERTDGPYGTGNVTFNETAFRGRNSYALTETSSFIGIDDARSVERLIRETFGACNDAS